MHSLKTTKDWKDDRPLSKTELASCVLRDDQAFVLTLNSLRPYPSKTAFADKINLEFCHKSDGYSWD